MTNYHTSVLLKTAVDYLDIHKTRLYIDATLGGGGHTFEIVRRGGIVLGIDFDNDAIATVQKRIEQELNESEKNNITVRQGNFSHIDKIAKEAGFEAVSGILFDLGVSSYQFDTPQRGFSFQKEGPLDMRMDQDLAVTAGDLLKILTKGELYELFTKLGEEHRAHAIANSIIRARRIKPIETTTELATVVEKAVKREGSVHPATRIFQALRIAVNDELNNLKISLPKALSLLKSGGRLVVISFHSLEDRIVKQLFEEFENQNKGIVISKKPVTPTEDEIRMNNRSRSAKLRAFQKI